MNTMMLIGTAGTVAIIMGALILLMLIIGAWMAIRVIPQASAMVVQRLGKYKRTLETGFHMIIPILDKTLPMISLKEKVLDFDKVEVITKDNVKMRVDTIVFAQVVDAKLYTYGVENPMRAIDSLTATTLRNIIGEIDLDGTLTSRDYVNVKMRDIIDLATDPWGVKVRRVELKSILPPPTIQESMEREMRAERERREAVLRAEGAKKSAILVAEGEKESTLLRAEAQKLATIAEAEGQAQAIERILKAKPDAAYLTLQGFEAVKHMADGQATKIIVPNDLANVASMFTMMGEALGISKEPKTNPDKPKKTTTASGKKK